MEQEEKVNNKPEKEKKEKKTKKVIKKVKKIASPKRIAIVMAIIALVSFSYKLTIGIMATSLVLIIAAIPTFFVFVCKAVYAKNMNTTRKEKKITYLIMSIATASFSLLFIMFSVFKVGGIDITNKNRFEGWIGTIFIFFIILLFTLSIINLKGALRKTDLVVIGIKEISFVSALADAVMIQEFVYRVILRYLHLPFMDYVTRFFPLGVGILMAIVPIFMFRRFFKYKIEE